MFVEVANKLSNKYFTGFPIRSVIHGGTPQHQHPPPHTDFIGVAASLSLSVSVSRTQDEACVCFPHRLYLSGRSATKAKYEVYLAANSIISCFFIVKK